MSFWKKKAKKKIQNNVSTHLGSNQGQFDVLGILLQSKALPLSYGWVWVFPQMYKYKLFLNRFKQKYSINIRTVNNINMNYDILCKIFEEKGCKILDTETDINIKKELTKQKTFHHVPINYIASCGHTNKVVACIFKSRGTGILCKDCVRRNTGFILKDKSKQVMKIENDGFLYLQQILQNDFDIKKTPEGCEADFLIRPIHHPIDAWLKIQLKTTYTKMHNMYSFSVVPYKYGDDMVYICLCEKDDKIWCIERKEITHLKCKLNISKVSKYDKYECTHESLIEQLNDIYLNYLTINQLCLLNQGCIPKNIYQQREQKYIKIREALLPDWKFEYNSIEGLPYDFIVHEKHVQEKVSNSLRTKNIYNICLQRSGGKYNNINKKVIMIPYEEHHFDILWVHIDGKEMNYIIPMKELVERDYITTATTKGKRTMRLNINSQDAWYSKYQFKYNQLDKDSLLEIFQK